MSSKTVGEEIIVCINSSSQSCWDVYLRTRLIIDLFLLESMASGDAGAYNDDEGGQQNEEDAQEEYN